MHFGALGSEPNLSAMQTLAFTKNNELEVKHLNLILEENCKTIGNFNDKLVKSKWYRPILTDNYYSFIIAAERPDLNIKH